MKYRIDKILFLDIETVPIVQNYQDLDERLKVQWSRKAALIKKDMEQEASEMFEDRGGIYAEFGKIICIGLGYFVLVEGGITQFRLKCLSSRDEKLLLQDFLDHLSKFDQAGLLLCAHNGKEFDFPYLCRRLLINGLTLPDILDISGKKPWEVGFLDTMELWKFGDWKSYTSLDLMAAVFGVDSSKEDIDGSQVSEVYYKEDNLTKIADYCMRDVLVTARVFQKLQGLNPVGAENVVYS